MQYLPLSIIAEAYILHIHLSLAFSNGKGTFLIWSLLLLVQEGEDSLSCTKG